MRIIILFLVAAFLLLACEATQEENQVSDREATKVVEHLNLIILSDLSNRINDDLYPRQLTDIQIIEAIAGVFPDYIKTGGRLINQKDRMRLRLINKQEIPNFYDYENDLSIDLGEFERQVDRIEYLNGKAEQTLSLDIKGFQEASAEIYNKAYEKTSGSDIWTFFSQSFDETYLQLTNPMHNENVQDKARTVIIVLTDGYLEAGNYGDKFCEGNSCYYLSPSRINSFRKKLQENQNLEIEGLIAQENFRIKPVKNKHLSEVEILALEFYDRSKSGNGSASVYPTDYQITKALWNDWMENSGVKRSEIYETRESVNDIKRIVKSFLIP
jgi:hypothetical protein